LDKGIGQVFIGWPLGWGLPSYASPFRIHDAGEGRYQPSVGHVGGIYRERVILSWRRFAVIDDGLGFQLVPWRPALEQQLGRQVFGVTMSGGKVVWSFGRKHGLGL
jgi:hypothetical protein